jgi:hypothetical protein
MITLKERIVEALDSLTPAQQAQVWDAVRRAQATPLPPTISGEELARRMHEFRLPAEDVNAILAAIDEGCEQVNPDDWA